MGERERNRCHARLEALVGATLDAEQARHAAIAELRRAVGFERWCWPLTDPETGVAMSGIGELDFWPSLPAVVALEEHGDVTSKPRLILGQRASVALSTATRGDLTRSRRWRECLRPYGIGDELMTVCRDRHGCWGSVELMRDVGDPAFSEDDIALLEQLAPILGTLLRRGVASGASANHEQPSLRVPGTLVLDAALQLVGWTSTARDWLAELSGNADMLPAAVYEIGARVLTPAHAAHGMAARVRLRTSAGRWSAIEGALLETNDPDCVRVVITMRAGRAAEIFDLLCKAHGISPREQQLIALMQGGVATRQLAASLGISPYTVQDHLKSIFTKTDLRSRRAVLAYLASGERR